MSLYIHPENQELLWKIINKNPLIIQYFVQYPQGTQESWFKQIISNFYEQNRNILISTEQLLEINKNTIQYMIQDVKRNIEYQHKLRNNNQTINKQDFIQTFSDNKTTSLSDTGSNFYDNKTTSLSDTGSNFYDKDYNWKNIKEEQILSQYNQYQQNYNSMFNKKPPESINFKENIEEPTINNMDELIKKHIQERDEELKKYAPKPLFDILDPLLQEQNSIRIGDDAIKQSMDASRSPIKPNKLVIENEPIQFSIEDISTKDDIVKNHKVKWLDNENSDKIDDLRKDFIEFKSFVIDIFQKFLDKDKNKEPLKENFDYNPPLKKINTFNIRPSVSTLINLQENFVKENII
jgi:hypothetical protein